MNLSGKGIQRAGFIYMFDGFSITFFGAETIMVGEVIDQAALFGMLAKLNDLGLPLISVIRVE